MQEIIITKNEKGQIQTQINDVILGEVPYCFNGKRK